MKQIFSSLIIPLLVGLVVAYFAFNLNNESVDLRYTLSDCIIHANPDTDSRVIGMVIPK